MTLPRVMLLLAFAVAGAAVAWAYFALMRHAVNGLAGERRATAPFLGLLLLRLVIFGCGAAAALCLDELCLLPYMLAFLVVRGVFVRRLRARPNGGAGTS